MGELSEYKITMFKKILIANRGEIACRVIKTARRMGIATVAVYSDADADALHVEMADEAVHVGGAASAESYLVIDRILAACQQTGAEAVHPGYGFLSENAAFAEALDKAGIAFIGPPVGAIKAMGDKIESKKLAQKAGVSTVPGHTETVTDPEEAVKISQSIGYPVMLKASAGGGGKGMRLAYNDEEARSGLVAAMNEGRASFGDDRVFIEKFIEQPRHIEIQVLADTHGNCVYLGERECSIQRRHQKVLEEAPSPFLDEAVRKAMGKQAVALSQAVNYASAGTVEFIVDKDKNFYFLEMNTRLQVEHPVTELVTGLDLVELMLRVAAGETLPFSQAGIKTEGWALEARVYAEDPERGFLPSTGRLARYQAPEADGKTVRIDTGVREGAEISIYYDPMIAKLVTSGPTREAAIDAMRGALDGYYIRGLNHNIAFLSHLCAQERFRAGDMSTNFIAEEYPEGLSDQHLMPADHRIFAAVAAIIEQGRRRSSGVSEMAVFSTGEAPVETKLTLTKDAKLWQVAFEEGGTATLRTEWQPGSPLFKAEIDGQAQIYQVDLDEDVITLSHDGARLALRVVEARLASYMKLMPYKAPPDMSRFLVSPMPGLLVSVAVKEGDSVKAGQELAVVEAMKMENLMRAERDGVVKVLHAAAGDSLAVDQKIVEFE